MKIEDQVCSLELAKELKELGVKQSSLFYWVKPKARSLQEFTLQYIHWFDDLEEPLSLDCFEIYSAFTVAELGVLLPISIYCEDNTDDEMFIFTGRDIDGKWFINYAESMEIKEADVRAKALIWLIKNGHVNASLSESN